MTAAALELAQTAADAICAQHPGFALLAPVLPTIIRISPAVPPGMTAPQAAAEARPLWRLTDAAKAAGVAPERYRAYLRQMIVPLDALGISLREHRLERGDVVPTVEHWAPYGGVFVPKPERAERRREKDASARELRQARTAAKTATTAVAAATRAAAKKATGVAEQIALSDAEQNLARAEQHLARVLVSHEHVAVRYRDLFTLAPDLTAYSSVLDPATLTALIGA